MLKEFLPRLYLDKGAIIMKRKVTAIIFTNFVFSACLIGTQTATATSPAATRQIVPAVKATGKGIYRGSRYVGKKTWRGSRWVGLKVARGGKWVAVKTARGVKWIFVGNRRSRRP